MKALVIGGAGFVGGYLVSELNACSWEVHGTALEGETLAEGYIGHTLNILDRDSIRPLIDEIMPDVIICAQSSVSLSWKKPS